MIKFQSRWTRRVALAVAVIAAASTVLFGVRSYRSFVLLQSAYQVGLPQSSNVRAWMTLRYVAATFHVSEAQLIARLGLDANLSPEATLKSLADQSQVPPFQYVQRVQQSLADSVIAQSSTNVSASSSWLGRIRDDLLSALLKYGYPALTLSLVLGAVGLPVPTGLSAAIAGSLSATGRMNWGAAIAVGTAASVVGDMIAYALGRWLGADFLERRGRWIGLTPTRRVRLEVVFERWGGLLIVISRTLVSSLSTIVSFVAGMNRYRLSVFMSLAALGRVLWTSSYVGLGYSVGSKFDAATTFLANLSGLILSMFILFATVLMASGRRSRSSVKCVEARAKPGARDRSP